MKLTQTANDHYYIGFKINDYNDLVNGHKAENIRKVHIFMLNRESISNEALAGLLYQKDKRRMISRYPIVVIHTMGDPINEAQIEKMTAREDICQNISCIETVVFLHG